MNNKRIIVLWVGILLLLAGIVYIAFRVMRAENLADSVGNSSGGLRPVNEVEEDLTEELFAMDTVMDITLYRTEETDIPLRELFTKMRDRIYQMQQEFSVTDENSEISQLNRASGTGVWTTVSDDMWELVKQAADISQATKFDRLNDTTMDSVADFGEGSGSSTPRYAFDPTLYPIVKLWGFTTDEFRVPTEDEIQAELKKVSIENIETDATENKQDVRLLNHAEMDLGACVKGFLSDKLCEMMREHHVNGILSLGGNVQTVGTKPDGSAFVVGITDPADGSSLYTAIENGDEAVITSGNYQRYFEQDGTRYHHIMDSRTGAPADSGLASVTVIGESGLCCDAYATAFFVMGEELAKEYLNKYLPEYKVILIREDGTAWLSEGITEIGKN